eukprot:gb/GECH01011639.1/.p1 GENE.gb/GECH01011639.1/~~gb/GECH01011639.1/.p1  ORF type:complete len:240 (+),score=58.09 gb/GECH01011639.1/:1-720(+)
MVRKNALVTGASSGIGRTTALALAKSGYNVALMARRKDALTSVAEECQKSGVEAHVLPTDLLNKEAVNHSMDQVKQLLDGKLDVVVNNAGKGYRANAYEAEMEKWEENIRLNLIATMQITKLALPMLKAAGSGSMLLFIASIASRMSFGGSEAYSASKHGVLGFANSVFEDVREDGIKVCSLLPGFVATEMTTNSSSLDASKMIQTQDIADMILFLANFPTTACPTEVVIRPQRTPYIK